MLALPETDQMPRPPRPRRRRSKLDLLAIVNIKTAKTTDDPDIAVHSAKHAGSLLDRQDAQGLVRTLPSERRPDSAQPKAE